MNVHFRLPREPSIARTTLKMHAGCVTRDEIRGSANFGNESKRASSQPRVCSKFQSLRGEMLSDVNVWRVRREREQRSVLSFDRFSKRSIDDIARASESSSLLDLYSINAIILPDENPNIPRTKNFHAWNGVNFIWRGRIVLFSPSLSSREIELDDDHRRSRSPLFLWVVVNQDSAPSIRQASTNLSHLHYSSFRPEESCLHSWFFESQPPSLALRLLPRDSLFLSRGEERNTSSLRTDLWVPSGRRRSVGTCLFETHVPEGFTASGSLSRE